jgi:hypothetical protein
VGNRKEKEVWVGNRKEKVVWMCWVGLRERERECGACLLRKLPGACGFSETGIKGKESTM